MWEFNQTDNMYNNYDELYHYGVLGMRWGHRNNSNVQNAYKAYKQSKKDYRKEKIKNVKNVFKKSNYVAGVKNQESYKKNHKGLTDATNKREKAAFKLIDASAKDAYNKKLAKTGSKEKAEKAMMKVHYKGFKQDRYGSGRIGSIADSRKNHGVINGNKHYYDHLVKNQGKKYASSVEKKYNKKTTRELVGGLAVATGLAITSAYINNKYK